MKLYQRLAVGSLSLLLALLVGAGCEARAPAQKTTDYDFYVLALSLAPAFCEDALGHRQLPRQCWNFDFADFQKQPLTLHGLWPNNRSGRHPFYCNGERDRGGMCDQTRVQLPAPLASKLAAAMPGAVDCLDRHEWAKHGSCSGLSMADYFDQSLSLVDRANRAMGSVLAAYAGKQVPLEVMRSQIRKQDPALLESVVFDCRTPRSNAPSRRKPMLREVRIYFHARPDGRPGEPMNFREAGAKHFNSGCPAAHAYIDVP